MRERDLFIEVLEASDPAERAALIDEACLNDPELRARVERLLAEHGREDSFILDTPPAEFNATVEPAISEGPGTIVGPYKLIEQIGEGGFGVVFLAEQDRPVRRKVALKIIKPGMDTRQIVRRFEAERQALAMMDHPNIAKVFDAGTTGEKGDRNLFPERPEGSFAQKVPVPFFEGRPYFVMELVQGVPITEYCDQCDLPMGERLELFITVCQAVQHAHQKGVIHRDLKPANILVAMQDGRPAPKIIDFGVAKALNQRLTEYSLATGYAQMIGTPLYMSPEQAELSPLGADTRSDIYSLGVILYELLTGTMPFEKDRIQSANFDQLRRILCEEDPPLPSTRIRALDTKTSSTIAEHRRCDVRRLQQAVCGDLDWIVMKCLDKDPGRRYQTAGSVAMDVQRYLCNEPIEACPPSALYRLQKLARRNRALLVGITLVVGTLIVGIAVSVSQAIRATRAESLATARLQDAIEARAAAEANARTARQAVDEMYTQVAEQWLAHQPQMEPIQRAFLEKALRFYTGFTKEMTHEPAVRFETAQAYRRIGEIQHRLGYPAEAEDAFHRAVDQLQSLVEEIPNEPDYREEQAATLHKLGLLLGDTGRSKEEEHVHRNALALEQELLGQFPDSPTRRRNVGRGHWFLGQALLALHRREDAEVELRSALAIQNRLAGEFPANSEYRYDLAQSYLRLGITLRFLHEVEECLQALESAAKFLESLVYKYPTVPDYRNELANAYYWHIDSWQERHLSIEQTQSYLNRAIALQKQLVIEYPSVTDYGYDLFRSYKTLGQTLTVAGKYADAESALRQAESMAEKLVANAPKVHYYRGGLAYVHTSLGELFSREGHPADAERAYRDAIRLLEALVSEVPDAPQYQRQLAETYDKLAAVLTAAGQSDEAAEAHRNAQRIRGDRAISFSDDEPPLDFEADAPTKPENPPPPPSPTTEN